MRIRVRMAYTEALYREDPVTVCPSHSWDRSESDRDGGDCNLYLYPSVAEPDPGSGAGLPLSQLGQVRIRQRWRRLQPVLVPQCCGTRSGIRCWSAPLTAGTGQNQTEMAAIATSVAEPDPGSGDRLPLSQQGQVRIRQRWRRLQPVLVPQCCGTGSGIR